MGADSQGQYSEQKENIRVVTGSKLAFRNSIFKGKHSVAWTGVCVEMLEPILLCTVRVNPFTS